MARRSGRGLREDEQRLWSEVTRTTRRIAVFPDPPPDPPAFPLPADAPPVSGQNEQRPLSNLPHALAPFQIGERAAPRVPEAVATAPPAMDRKTWQRLGRGRLVPEARLDLHGMTLSEAHLALPAFLATAAARGRRLVLIITGKGGSTPDAPRGVLRRQVPQWLRATPLSQWVQEVRPAHQRHGGDGALYVWLRRRG